jgi:hypothetical protein
VFLCVFAFCDYDIAEIFINLNFLNSLCLLFHDPLSDCREIVDI